MGQGSLGDTRVADQLFFPGGAMELNGCCSLQTCVYFPLIQPLGNNSVFLGILLPLTVSFPGQAWESKHSGAQERNTALEPSL